MRKTAATSLERQIARCMLADQYRLRRQWRGLLKRAREGKPADQATADLEDNIRQSIALRERRLQNMPQPQFPDALPVTHKLEEIADTLEKHQVVIVCGETGSGKSTQLPKLCLKLGRGVAASVAHTQPRRIAARAIASRVAEELGTEVGRGVGFKVRFSEQTSPESHIKVLTDGMLLSELQADPWLNQYDTIIIDEAHERSLNIDFLLGILQRLLPKRPDLKLIITSATIDPDRFSRHFGNAPVINVSGRTFPVEVRYRPLLAVTGDGEDRDMPGAILDAVNELSRAGSGDILVFLAGERDIRENAEYLRKRLPPTTEILPLYARLSVADQQRVFRPHKGRRIVLATNVAETSITVPGVRYVVDTGVARISRYSPARKVLRLPVEKISQAAANQRSGRCGRVAEGIALRLYDEADFLSRPAFTDPEILRSSLADVILRMQSMRLGEIESFPFLDPPERKMVNDGYKLLQELDALDAENRITQTGRKLARLPVDPRIARILLAGAEKRCLREILVIAAALEIPDPREEPEERKAAARQTHARYRDPRSDFMSWFNLWQAWHTETENLSQRQRRQYCRDHFLSWTRLREWREVYRQLKALMADNGHQPGHAESSYEDIHRALLSGLLGNIAQKGEQSEYQGTRGKKLWVFPGSALMKKPPRWLLSAELVDTSRLYARTNAEIQPEWVEQAATSLVSRSYLEPHWEKRAGQVVAYEQISLYGLILVPRRRVNFGPIDPIPSREIMIREGLVTGELHTRHDFLKRNMAVLAEIEELEQRSRRRDILVQEDEIYDFYDQRIPAGICNTAALDAWIKEARPDLLMKPEDFMQHEAGEITEQAYPEKLKVKNITCPLSYHFEPDSEDDGVTATLPLAALNQLQDIDFDRLVPALLTERITALIRALPKRLRRHFAPAPEFARILVDALNRDDGPMRAVMARELHRMSGVGIQPNDWDESKLANHLRMNFRVIDERGKTLASGRDLEQLKSQLRQRASASFRRVTDHGIERSGITNWDFGDLPRTVEIQGHGVSLTGYPALHDDGDSCSIKVVDREDTAQQAHRRGLTRLFELQMGKRLKLIGKNLPDLKQLCLHYSTIGGCEALREDIIANVIERAFIQPNTEIYTQAQFKQRLQAGYDHLGEYASDVCRALLPVLKDYQTLIRDINESAYPASDEIKTTLYDLVYPGFVARTPWHWLRQFPRYLRGARIRLDRLATAADRDAQRAQQFSHWWEQFEQARKDGLVNDNSELRWLLEEYRISLFAQEVKTSVPISEKRLAQAFDTLGAKN